MRIKPSPILLAGIVALLAACDGRAQDAASRIRLNQVGFYPGAPKAAVVVDAPGDVFHVVAEGRADTVFSGTLGPEQAWPVSQERVRVADFGAFAGTGTFVVVVPGLGASHPFRIAPAVHASVARDALRGFYYQRMSTPLRPEHAGAWSRPAGHPDVQVLVHPSAASGSRPAGTVLSSPKGWYDAGDYNKYIVNSGITTATLLSLYEHHPDAFARFDLGLPESGDAVPDLLDEVLWNLRWMLTMQDPQDGGVYHKLTNPGFDGMVMPHEATAPRYVVRKSTAAALDLAAVAAQAARVFRPFDAVLPGLADSCLAAAERAWGWARRHPAAYYRQNDLNREFDPDVSTGTYGDGDVSDEFRWAAAELFVTTRRDSFVAAVDPLPASLTVPSWPDVGTMGVLSLAFHRAAVSPAVDSARVKALVVELAGRLVAARSRSAYGLPFGDTRGDFVWGSSAVAANQGMVLLHAFRLTGDAAYRDAALANLDYLLGRNATGYSFVTGHGSRRVMHPHHRPSEADGVADPVPGLLSGGPNPGRQDGCAGYPSPNLPATSFVDDVCSYASNEIAINWNAPLAYLAGALEALLR